MKVAILGQPGSQSEQAVCELYPAAEIVACPAFEAVFDAVEADTCEIGVIPIEHSVTGSIVENYDLLLRRNLFIVNEAIVTTRHCLVGLPGARSEEIRQVSSHPQALSQCARFLRQLNAETESAPDTVTAVQRLSLTADRTRAAIASRRAAELYEMEILAEDIEDNPAGSTRFLALAKKQILPEGDAKTFISFTLVNQPGALFGVLKGFSAREINILKIITRPIAGEIWGTAFFMDFVGNLQETRVEQALAELARSALTLRVFGSYPRRS